MVPAEYILGRPESRGSMSRTIVVGGGIVGASVAYHLARDGVKTLLVDREDSSRATDAAAGIVSPATSSQSDSDEWYDFGVRAFEYFPELVAALEDEQDGETGYDERGLLSVAVDEDELEEYEAAKRRTLERVSPGGYLDPDSVYELSADEARDRFPPLAPPRRALYYEDAARIDGRTFAVALRRAGERYGLVVENAFVESLDVEDGAVTGVVTEDGTRHAASNVVVAGGAWSSEFGDQVGVDIPVAPVRGQVVHVELDGDTTAWPIVMSHRDKVFAPWSSDRVAVGATREDDAGFAARPTVTGIRTVLEEIERVAPGLGDAELVEMRVGLRPVSADTLPVLGSVPGVDGIFLATGHGATGITLGPYSGRLIADAVQGREPPMDLEPYRVTRFD